MEEELEEDYTSRRERIIAERQAIEAMKSRVDALMEDGVVICHNPDPDLFTKLMKRNNA